MHFMDEQERDLLPTYIHVDTFIIGECKKPCRLEKACLIKRTFI